MNTFIIHGSKQVLKLDITNVDILLIVFYFIGVMFDVGWGSKQIFSKKTNKKKFPALFPQPHPHLEPNF